MSSLDQKYEFAEFKFFKLKQKKMLQPKFRPNLIAVILSYLWGHYDLRYSWYARNSKNSLIWLADPDDRTGKLKSEN